MPAIQSWEAAPVKLLEAIQGAAVGVVTGITGAPKFEKHLERWNIAPMYDSYPSISS